MNDEQELFVTRWTFLIAIIGVLGVILSTIIVARAAWQLQIVKLKPLPSYRPLKMQRISDLWYSSSGRLIATVEFPSDGNVGPVVAVYSWDMDDRPTYPPREILNFGELTGEPGRPTLISPFTTASQPPEESGTEPTTPGLPYAVSEDGSMVAWAWKGKLFAGPLADPDMYKLPLHLPDPVVALSFFEKDLIGVIHSNAEFRFERIPTSEPDLGGMPTKGPWRISGRGSSQVVSNLGAGDGYLVKSDFDYKRFPASAAGTFIIASKLGKIATGTKDGTILYMLPSGDTPQVLLPERGRIQTLAFLDEENLIASIDGGRLYLIKNEERFTSMNPTPLNARLLAVEKSRIAMVTSSQILVGKLKNGWNLDERLKLWIAITFYVLSFIALLRLMVGDGLKVWTLRRGMAACRSSSSSSEDGDDGAGSATDQPAGS